MVESTDRNWVLLPETRFPARRSDATETQLLQRWQSEDLYGQIRKARAGQKRFILHDGPPYANGAIHLGHAINKILKDAIVRSRTMAGFDAPFVPGWDCHGLPIEWAVERQMRDESVPLDRHEMWRRCRSYAAHSVAVQAEAFQRLAVSADWAEPYLTMNEDAETGIIDCLGQLIVDGHIVRKFGPTWWSPVEQTALAEAEIEYQEMRCLSVYVAFPIVGEPDTAIVAWTTTPWTLPLNEAAMYNPNISYVQLSTDRGKFIVAEKLAAQLLARCPLVEHSREAVPAARLVGVRLLHPWTERHVPLLIDDSLAGYVTDDEGSGFVHLAPAHGDLDFYVGQQHGLDLTCRVDEQGRYRGVTGLDGLAVLQAEDFVVGRLGERGRLLGGWQHQHRYPHSWRSHSKLIYRTTPQWFIRTKELAAKAMAALDDIQWIPASAQSRMAAMLKERPDWCISRQRVWGVPLPLIVHRVTGEPVRDPAVQAKIYEVLRVNGIETWWQSHPQRFLTRQYDPDDYELVRDIVDVWFESGCSHAYVVKKRLRWPADLYLEGTDQHRGWFQSSLLSSIALFGKPPYRAVLTHGFVLDRSRLKLSKSRSNAVDAVEYANKFGADVLRLWCLGSRYTEDIGQFEDSVDQHRELYQRFRLTLRFLLGNLRDRPVELDRSTLPLLERWVLHRVAEVSHAVAEAFKAYDFPRAIQEIYTFCDRDLSRFYFDARKDRLYCDPESDRRRQQCLAVLTVLFRNLLRWLAPITPVLAEEAYLVMPGQHPSVHLLRDFDRVDPDWYDTKLDECVASMRAAQSAIHAAIEPLRQQGLLGSQAAAEVVVNCRGSDISCIDPKELTELMQLAQLEITFGGGEYIASATVTDKQRCPRCRRHDRLVSELCRRCTDATKFETKESYDSSTA